MQTLRHQPDIRVTDAATALRLAAAVTLDRSRLAGKAAEAPWAAKAVSTRWSAAVRVRPLRTKHGVRPGRGQRIGLAGILQGMVPDAEVAATSDRADFASAGAGASHPKVTG